MTAYKADDNKPQMDLIPPEVMFAMADILTRGATKYPSRNWEQGMRWGRVFAALMRHLWAWWANKGPDPEFGLSHLHHALACLTFLVTYETRRIGEDDRPLYKATDSDEPSLDSRQAVG
jgi:hypothetical protein